MLAGFWGFYEREPCRVRFSIHICDDLYTLTIVQCIVEWHDLTIDFCYRELVSDLTVDRIGEVDRSRSFWKCDDISLRCEDEYLI